MLKMTQEKRENDNNINEYDNDSHDSFPLSSYKSNDGNTEDMRKEEELMNDQNGTGFNFSGSRPNSTDSSRGNSRGRSLSLLRRRSRVSRLKSKSLDTSLTRKYPLMRSLGEKTSSREQKSLFSAQQRENRLQTLHRMELAEEKISSGKLNARRHSADHSPIADLPDLGTKNLNVKNREDVESGERGNHNEQNELLGEHFTETTHTKEDPKEGPQEHTQKEHTQKGERTGCGTDRMLQ
jgi:hypothetical protein